jgi:DNA-binding CsgD family transcriptional regulator
VVLIGREAERERIERLLDRARRGDSGVLVLRGEAGAGKTALLRHAIDFAEDMTVARAAGVESEAELEFSGLLDVCRPLVPWLEELPPQPASLLRGVLGLAERRPADRFAVGAATLALLAAAAEARPLLLVVDDALWLDEASADAMRFAARRLLADRVAVLFAYRSGERGAFGPYGFEELELEALPAPDARVLLERSAGGPLSDETVARLYDATGGNPLALIELPELLRLDQLAERLDHRAPLPAGTNVERAFSRRLERLDTDARRALTVLAAASARDLATVVAALRGLSLDVSTLERAEEAGLVELDDLRFAFRHPLLRAVAYQTAPAAERRQAHRALAEALANEGRVGERRAWHLAAAAIGPDAEAAQALADTAREARDHGGHAAAAAAFERAARLTPDRDDRLERLADAAEAAWSTGDVEHALALVDEASATGVSPAHEWRLLVLRGRVELQAGTQAGARRHFLAAADAVEATEPARAATALGFAIFSCHYEGAIAESVELARRMRALVRNGDASDWDADYVLGRSLLLAGQAQEGVPHLERVATELLALAAPSRAQLARAAITATVLERVAEARELVARVNALAREEGPMPLVYALTLSAQTEARDGRWQRAVASATEGVELARELGQANVLATLFVSLAVVAAGRGDREAFETWAAQAAPIVERAGMKLQREQLRTARGVLELGLDRPADAAAGLADAVDEVAAMSLLDREVAPEPELVEALVRLDRVDDARLVFERWQERGAGSNMAWDAALASRCRGLLADSDFVSELAEAVAAHERIDDAYGAARTRLLFGGRLRRAGLRMEARRELRLALASFGELEAEAWAEQARRELRATGEKLRRATFAPGDELTPQELQVALQVAEGKSNKEVAAALFLSPKTVEFHLVRVFRKLAIQSRTELVRRVSREGAEALPVG